MRVGSLLDDFGHAPANLNITVRGLRIDDSYRHTRIAAHVLVLLTSLRSINDNQVAIEVDPNRSDLRAAIGHERCQAAERALGEKIAVLLRNGLRHEFLLARTPRAN